MSGSKWLSYPNPHAARSGVRPALQLVSNGNIRVNRTVVPSNSSLGNRFEMGNCSASEPQVGFKTSHVQASGLVCYKRARFRRRRAKSRPGYESASLQSAGRGEIVSDAHRRAPRLSVSPYASVDLCTAVPCVAGKPGNRISSQNFLCDDV